MEKVLNVKCISERMIQKGLSQSSIADTLGVSRAIVSSWLKPDKFPRPKHLLELSSLLALSYDELVLTIGIQKPKVAFRKTGNFKIRPEHEEKFNYTSRLLENLTNYLEFDRLSSPATLREPKCEYEYIQKAATIVRKAIAPKNHTIEFTDLIHFFAQLNAVLIPVMWGPRHYKAGTHIYLPESQTTWVYLNLDSKTHDFKFWMAHELGHAKAPDLLGEEGEVFADRFAGALLFPKQNAEEAYSAIVSKSKDSDKFGVVEKLAKEYVISPITIYKQVEEYANASSLASTELEKIIYKYTAEFNKSYKTVSADIFGVEHPEVSKYVLESTKLFKTCFFDSLKKYLLASGESPKFVANLMDVSIEDAQEIFGYVINNDF